MDEFASSGGLDVAVIRRFQEMLDDASDRKMDKK